MNIACGSCHLASCDGDSGRPVAVAIATGRRRRRTPDPNDRVKIPNQDKRRQNGEPINKFSREHWDTNGKST